MTERHYYDDLDEHAQRTREKLPPEPDRVDIALELARVRRMCEGLTSELEAAKRDREAMRNVLAETTKLLEVARAKLQAVRVAFNLAEEHTIAAFAVAKGGR